MVVATCAKNGVVAKTTFKWIGCVIESRRKYLRVPKDLPCFSSIIVDIKRVEKEK